MNPIMCVLPVSRCANYAAPSTPTLGARSSASDLQCGRRSLVAGDHRDGPEHGPEAGTAPEASEGADAHRVHAAEATGHAAGPGRAAHHHEADGRDDHGGETTGGFHRHTVAKRADQPRIWKRVMERMQGG